MKLQKLALTALALSMGTAFAAGNTDKQAEGSSANQAPMAQSATANQPSSSTANQAASSSTNQAASSSANQSASSSTNQAASGTNGSQSGMSSFEGSTAQADPQVRQVQQALKDKGHDPGPIDGIMGPQTKQALESFQQQQGLSGGGELDQQTLAALGVQGDSLASNASGSQPSSANSGSMSGANQASSGNQAASSASQASSGNQASSGSANQSASSTNQGYTKQ